MATTKLKLKLLYEIVANRPSQQAIEVMAFKLTSKLSDAQIDRALDRCIDQCRDVYLPDIFERAGITGSYADVELRDQAAAPELRRPN